MISRRWNGATYEDLLAKANLPALEKRRLELKLCHLFKIVHNMIYFPSDAIAQRESPHYHFRSSHDHYLSQPFARTNSYFYSFVPHTVSLWNSLPSEILSLPSLNSFKLHVRDFNLT